MADYFGFNLRVLRILAIIAFVVAMPMAVIAYLAAVFLIPARSSTTYERVVVRQKPEKQSRRARRRAKKEAKRQQEAGPSEAAIEVRDKCRSLDKRLADLEKHITSSRYQLDREIRNL
jgi:phage shock protein C